jgi:hypothetical protein
MGQGDSQRHALGQVNNLRAVLTISSPAYLCATRTTVASCKPTNSTSVSEYMQSPFLVLHRSETLPARTATVAITDDDPNVGL